MRMQSMPDPALPPDLGEVLEFMRLLWAVSHGMQKTSKHMARQLGLTGPQRLGLRLIGRFPGVAAGELAHLLRLHPSTLTGILLRLERQGLIERRPDATDRRRSHLFLTVKGQRANQPTSGTVETAVKAVLARLGERRVSVAAQVLEALAEQLMHPGEQRAKGGRLQAGAKNARASGALPAR
jgi:MarR family transcriptional regulator, organic hydroperoxide resistance regulator